MWKAPLQLSMFNHFVHQVIVSWWVCSVSIENNKQSEPIWYLSYWLQWMKVKYGNGLFLFSIITPIFPQTHMWSIAGSHRQSLLTTQMHAHKHKLWVSLSQRCCNYPFNVYKGRVEFTLCTKWDVRNGLVWKVGPNSLWFYLDSCNSVNLDRCL